MSSKLKKISVVIGIIIFFIVIGLFVLIQGIARSRFKTQSYADMEMIARVKRASFETSMNEQLTLVLQMM